MSSTWGDDNDDIDDIKISTEFEAYPWSLEINSSNTILKYEGTKITDSKFEIKKLYKMLSKFKEKSNYE